MIFFFSISLLPTSTLGQTTAPDPASFFSPQIKGMLDQVEQSDLEDLMADLSGEQAVTISGEPYTLLTRTALSGEPNRKAVQYLFEYYDGLGLSVSLQEFNYLGRTLSNVVANKTGTIFPERVLMITSHMDDMPESGPAPGADDDASGTAGVMLAAEILNQYEFGCTLRFVNFNAEEYGKIGSQDFAREAYCSMEDLRGVINLDMIAWNTIGSSPDVDLHAHPSVTGSVEISDLFQQVVSTYGINILPTRAVPVTAASDHASFWLYDFPAILVSEDRDDFNPYYHTSEDHLDNLGELDYMTNIVKASLGTLAHLGCLVEDGWGSIHGTAIDDTTGLPVPGAHVKLHNPEWDYTFYTTSDVNGSYQFSALEGWHEISADAFGYASTLPGNVYVSESQVVQVESTLEPMDETAYYFPILGNEFQQFLPGCP